jgi:hypothetical protein
MGRVVWGGFDWVKIDWGTIDWKVEALARG